MLPPTKDNVELSAVNVGESLEDEINLLDLLEVLVKRKRLIISMTVTAAIISVVCSLLMTPIYKATARIIPPPKESGGGGLAALAGQFGGLAGMAGIAGMGGPTDLYLGILKSRSVAVGVFKRLNLDSEYKAQKPDDAHKILAGKVKFQAGAKDGIITIDAYDVRPERAAQLANGFVEELDNATVRLNLSKASIERSFLEKRLEVVKQDLRNAEDALKDFSQKNKTIQVDSQAKASIEAVARLKAELAVKEVQLSTLRSSMTDENPEVRAVLSAIARLRQEIGASSGVEGVADAVPAVGSVPSLGVVYTRLLRQVKVQEAIYEQLSKQYEFTKLAEAKDSASIQVIDQAVVPTRKDKPNRSLIVILSTFTSFLISAFVAFLLEYYEKLPVVERERLRGMYKSLLQWRRH